VKADIDRIDFLGKPYERNRRCRRWSALPIGSFQRTVRLVFGRSHAASRAASARVEAFADTNGS